LSGSQIAAIGLAIEIRQFLEGTGDEIGIAVRIFTLFEVDDIALVVERLHVAGPLPAAALAQFVGNLVGVAAVGRVQVDVVGDQELAGADRGRAGPAVERRRPEIRFPFGTGQLVGETLVLAGPHVGQVAPLGAAGRVLVQVHGDAQLVANASADRARNSCTIIHGDAGDGHEGADVGGPEAGVLPFVFGHVDQGCCRLDGAERGLLDRTGRPDKSNHRAVGARSGVDVQQLHAADAFDRVRDLPNDAVVAPLGEVRYTFDNLVHGGKSGWCSLAHDNGNRG
jgi:hypothetical protein